VIVVVSFVEVFCAWVYWVDLIGLINLSYMIKDKHRLMSYMIKDKKLGCEN